MTDDITARADEIRELIQTADYDRAFSRLVDFARDFATEDMKDEALVLSGSYRGFTRERRQGLVSRDEARQSVRQVLAAALQLIADIAETAARRVGTPAPAPAEPASKGRIYVSYAWADETDPARDDLVNRLVDDAAKSGITIERDRNSMSVGDSIEDFMEEIGAADRIVVILSEKYMRSPFCMFELYRIWMEAAGKKDRFTERIAVFVLEDAAVWTIEDRVAHTRYWQTRYRDAEAYLSDMGADDRVAHSRMKMFAIHVGDILASITNMVLPQNYQELREFALRASPDL